MHETEQTLDEATEQLEREIVTKQRAMRTADDNARAESFRSKHPARAKEIAMLVEVVADVMKLYVEAQLAPLHKRIAELEQRLIVKKGEAESSQRFPTAARSRTVVAA
jgi:hypothetical protein